MTKLLLADGLSLPPDIATRMRARLDAKTERTATCWLWTGYRKSQGGHGAIYVGEQAVYVHRLAYALAYGPIGLGLVVCHRCDVPTCVRPDHLFLGTQADNVADMESKGRARKVAVSGETHPNATLTDADVAQLRALYETGSHQQRGLAHRFGVSQSTVWRLVHGVTRGVA